MWAKESLMSAWTLPWDANLQEYIRDSAVTDTSRHQRSKSPQVKINEAALTERSDDVMISQDDVMTENSYWHKSPSKVWITKGEHGLSMRRKLRKIAVVPLTECRDEVISLKMKKWRNSALHWATLVVDSCVMNSCYVLHVWAYTHPTTSHQPNQILEDTKNSCFSEWYNFQQSLESWEACVFVRNMCS